MFLIEFIVMGVFLLLGAVGGLVPFVIIPMISKRVSNSSQKFYEDKCPLICPYCSSLNPPEYKFCTSCGGDLENAEKKKI